MTIEEIESLLKDALAQLDQAGITSLEKLKLGQLVNNLETQILMKSFDPLRDITHMTVVDVTKLRELIPQVRQVIRDQQKLTETVGKIIHIAKSGLMAAGVHIPV